MVEIPANRPLQELSRLTLQAALLGADAIYQAVLYHPPWRGNADFLIKCKAPSPALGAFSYEVLDTKLARSASPEHILQLCIYSYLLEAFQGLRPRKMHLYLGDGSCPNFSFQNFIYYSSHIRKQFERFIQNPLKESSPEPCSHCPICQWREHCSEEWKQKDHLSRVANIRCSQSDKLRKADIQTMAALADMPKRDKIKGLSQEILSRLKSQALLQTQKSQTGQNQYQIIEAPEGKGFARLPKPQAGDVFFDMEGDPFFPKGLEYLFGVYCPLKGKSFTKQFWGHNHKEEKESFNLFMDFIENHLKAYPEAFIYHYNHYEPTALKRLAGSYALREELLDNLLRQNKFIDLYLVVKESLRTSEPGYSLKNMETFYMENREDTVSTALDSIIIYNQWRETGPESLLKDIASYNATDCFSTWKLRDWLLKLKSTDTPWFQNSYERDSKPLEQKDWEKEYEHFQKRLSEVKEDKELTERLSSLLEFHKREEKVQWWNCFNRRDKGEEDLIEDRDCLGGLKLQKEPERKGQSLIYSYTFPPQEHRMKTRDSVFNTATMKSAGSIVELNDSKRTVQIKYKEERGKTA